MSLPCKAWPVVLGLVLANFAAAAGSGADVVRATRLPETADDLRNIGIPEGDLGVILDAARHKGLGAGEAQDALERVKTIEKAGHVDNLGATVKAAIDSGLRGQELAAAIQAAKGSQGNGLGRPEEPPGQAGEQGRSAEAHEKNDAKDAQKDKDKEKGGSKVEHSPKEHVKKGGK